MHTIFETDAFVLKSHPSGEANKILELFTRDFGFIRASAQGLRQYRSKLRYSLTDFALVRVSLVRGREFWRITTATKKESVISDMHDDQAREAVLRVFALLRRLLQGEDQHAELFDLVMGAFKALQESPEPIIEELTVLRILFLLGYVRDEPAIHVFVQDISFDASLLSQAQDSRKHLVLEINRALKASGL